MNSGLPCASSTKTEARRPNLRSPVGISRWCHVGFDADGLVVEDSKSGESPRVPLHPAALAKRRAARGLPDGYVIALASGDQPLSHSVTVAFRRAAVGAGLKNLRSHVLRHVVGTRLPATGTRLPEAVSFIDHKTFALSRRCGHVSWNRMRTLVSNMRISGLDGEAGSQWRLLSAPWTRFPDPRSR